MALDAEVQMAAEGTQVPREAVGGIDLRRCGMPGKAGAWEGGPARQVGEAMGKGWCAATVTV